MPFHRIPDALSNRNTIFFLAEKDAILNARRVMRYLKDHGVKTVEEGGNLHFMKGVAHGELACSRWPIGLTYTNGISASLMNFILRDIIQQVKL